MSKQKLWKKLFALGIIWIGIPILLYPYLQIVWSEMTVGGEEKAFVQQMKDEGEAARKAKEADALKYNQSLQTDQVGFSDPFQGAGLRYGNVLQGLNPDSIIGYLEADRIDLRLPIYFGASWDNLGKGGAVIDGTSLPEVKGNGRCVIAAHRGWYEFSGFRYIDSLQPGDTIRLLMYDLEYEYVVKDSEVIQPWESDKLLPKGEVPELTLLTCHPWPYDSQRLLVNADLARYRDPYADAKSVWRSLKGNPEEATASDGNRPEVAGSVRLQYIGFRILVVAGLLFWVFITWRIIRLIRRLRSNTPEGAAEKSKRSDGNPSEERERK